MSQVNKLAQNAANNNSPSNPASKSQPQATATKEPKSGTAQTSHAIEESELKPPIFQFIVNLILQIAAFAVAIAFGIYAVKSVREAAVANNYANQALNTATAANKLTLLALCMTSNSAVSCPFAKHIRSLTLNIFADHEYNQSMRSCTERCRCSTVGPGL